MGRVTHSFLLSLGKKKRRTDMKAIMNKEDLKVVKVVAILLAVYGIVGLICL